MYSKEYTKALKFATDAHSGQQRKYNGLPYISHPIAVARLVGMVKHTDEMLQAALMHDVVEDTPVTLKQIRKEFGDTVADYVSFLTDVSKPSDGNRKVRKNLDSEHNSRGPAESQTIKVADLIHNSVDIKVLDPAFWVQYKQEKLHTLSLLTKADPDLVALAHLFIEAPASEMLVSS